MRCTARLRSEYGRVSVVSNEVGMCTKGWCSRYGAAEDVMIDGLDSGNCRY